jgi:hypothetical protein
MLENILVTKFRYDLDDDIPLAQLCNMVRQGSELNYDQMDEIESSLPTEETYDGDWEKSLLNEFKSRNVSDDEESNCRNVKKLSSFEFEKLIM